MTYESVISPLAITAGAGFLGLPGNTPITVNSVFTTNITTYQNSALIGNLLYTVNAAASNVTLSISGSTLNALKTIGNTVCPALGGTASSNVLTTANISNSMVAQQMFNVGNSYVSNVAKFCQAFSAAEGYIAVTNPVIESVFNANEYLGPTFTNMDNHITGNLTRVSLALKALGEDLADQGQLLDFGNLPALGTPAGLLQQISKVGDMPGGSFPAIQQVLTAVGLSLQDVADLVNDNVQTLFNPTGLTPNQFDTLQKKAYPALCEIKDADLQDVLALLDIRLSDITSLCQLLNPVKIFPRSFSTLTLPTPSGDILIYNTNGSVNSEVETILNSGTLVPQGCDQLSKIIPPAQAVANRALQVSFAQVTGITGITAPQLAAILV